jgi:hypothetical protein
MKENQNYVNSNVDEKINKYIKYKIYKMNKYIKYKYINEYNKINLNKQDHPYH